MNTEIVPVDQEQQVRFLPTQHETGRIGRLAEHIARTEFVPKGLRGNPPAIMAAMLTGREIGIGAMHSLRAIDVIDGRPSLSPELMASLVLRHPAGHELYPEEATRERCVMVGRRGEWPTDRTVRVEWSLDDARLAGLVGESCTPETGVHDEREVTKNGRNGTYTKVECGCRQGWRTYPRAMLRARATAELARAIFPDVVERVSYTVEELGGEAQPHAEAMETVRDVAPDEAEVVEATYADDDHDQDDEHLEDDTPDGNGTDTPEPPANETPDSSADVEAEGEAAETSAEDEHADVPSAVREDWRAAAREAGVAPTDVLKEIIAVWPRDNLSARPNRLGDLDRLVAANVDWARKVAAVIDEKGTA